jgi:hypothetical protein
VPLAEFLVDETISLSITDLVSTVTSTGSVSVTAFVTVPAAADPSTPTVDSFEVITDSSGAAATQAPAPPVAALMLVALVLLGAASKRRLRR